MTGSARDWPWGFIISSKDGHESGSGAVSIHGARMEMEQHHGSGDESRQVILDLNYETGRFGLTMESYIRYDPDLLSFDYGTGSTRGVEWTARKKDGFLSGWISYRLNRSEYRLDRYPEDRSTAAYQDRTHEFKAVSTCHLGSIRFSLIGCFASGSPYTRQNSMIVHTGEYIIDNGAFNGSRLPAYERVDFKFRNDSNVCFP